MVPDRHGLAAPTYTAEELACFQKEAFQINLLNLNLLHPQRLQSPLPFSQPREASRLSGDGAHVLEQVHMNAAKCFSHLMNLENCLADNGPKPDRSVNLVDGTLCWRREATYWTSHHSGGPSLHSGG